MLLVILGFLAATALGVVSLYNKLVRSRFIVDEAWSGIDVQLQKRHDLIPNLVEIVKEYSTHERSTLEEVTRLRTECQNTATISEKGQLEKSLSSGIARIMALAESYPDLKADKNFRQLQEQLVAVEDELQLARRYYNGAVRNYNITVESFPSLLIARQFNFKSREFFQINEESVRAVPSVAN